MTIGKAIVDRIQELDMELTEELCESVAMHLAQGRIWIVSVPTKHFGFAEKTVTVKRLQKAKLWPK